LGNGGFRPRDHAALEFIDDCVQQANEVRSPLEPGWAENWGNYRVESSAGPGMSSKGYPLASGGMNRFEMSPINFLKTPESHQGVNTLRALLLAGLFGTRDYVQADPVGDEDIEASKRVSRLVMYGLERPGNFRTNFECLGDSLITGLGSYTARWKNQIRLVPRRIPVPDPFTPGEFLRNPETGSIMTVLQNIEAPIYDDPTLETDDLWRTWFDPSANRFDQLNWKVKSFKIRDEELETLQGDPNWDGEGIVQVLLGKPDARATGPDNSDNPKLLTENLTEEDLKDIAEYGYYGGYMLEGTVPRSVADKIGGIDPRGTCIIRTINGICVQSIQSPQRNGRIQGGTFTILPTGRGIYGLSPLTIVRYLQDVSDTQLILTVQALIESVYQNYVIGGDLGPNFARDFETRRPREVFTTQGDVEQLQPVPKDYAGIQIATGALQLISQTMRNAMNARDPVQGIMAQGGDTTATETLTVAHSALQNTDQIAVLIERDELPVQGMLINDLYYVNLDDEAKVFRRVGESETTSVSYFDIDSVTDITFVGARSVLTRQAKANQFRDFAMMLSSNPLTMASTDWHELVRRYGDEALDVKGLERLMIQDPEEIVARLQAMGLSNTIGPAAGGAGPGGGSPSTKGRSNPGNGGGLRAVNSIQGAGEAS
jgi:hypothetical protein